MEWIMAVSIGVALVLTSISMASTGRVKRFWKAYERFRSTGRCEHGYTRIGRSEPSGVALSGEWCRICDTRLDGVRWPRLREPRPRARGVAAGQNRD